MSSPTNQDSNQKASQDQTRATSSRIQLEKLAAEAVKVQPVEVIKLPALRIILTHSNPGWKMTQFAPHAVYKDVELMKRAIGELQDVMSILIDRINNCQDC